MYSRKEKALKIYTHNDTLSSIIGGGSATTTLDGASNYQAQDLD